MKNPISIIESIIGIILIITGIAMKLAGWSWLVLIGFIGAGIIFTIDGVKHSNKPVEPKAPEGKIDLTDYHGSEQSRKTIMALNALIDSIEKDSNENPQAKNNNAFNAYHELIMKMVRLASNPDFQSLGWETDRNLLYDLAKGYLPELEGRIIQNIRFTGISDTAKKSAETNLNDYMTQIDTVSKAADMMAEHMMNGARMDATSTREYLHEKLNLTDENLKI